MSTESYKGKRTTATGVIERVNAVKKFVMSPCDADPMVYVETVFQPAGTAIIQLLSFGMSDVIRGFARPKAARSQKRYRGKRPKTIRIGGRKIKLQIPEIGNRIGKALSPDKIQNRTVSKGVASLWKLDGVGQRILWHVLVADVVSEFAYDWSSAIIDESCTPEKAFRPRWASGGPWSADIRPNRTQFVQPTGPQVQVDTFFSGGGMFFGNFQADAVVAITFQVDVVIPNNANAIITIATDGDGESQVVTLTPGAVFDFMLTRPFQVATFTVHNPDNVFLSIAATVGWYQMSLSWTP